MKHLSGAVMVIVAVLAAGCTYSLHPLYLPGQQVFDDRLLGTWVIDEVKGVHSSGTFTYELTEPKAFRHCRSMRDMLPEVVCPYQLVERQLRGDGAVVEYFEAVLVSLDGKLFIDIYPSRPADWRDRYPLYTGMHYFVRVWTTEPKVRLSLALGASEKAMEEGLPYVYYGEEKPILLTASTQQVQAFLLRHDEIEGFWNVPVELTRKPAE